MSDALLSSRGFVVNDHIITELKLEDDLTGRLEGAATFTRSTTGTFLDKDTGLVTTAAIDTPRFEVNGILIEGAITNFALHNRDFTNIVHTKTNATALKDAVGADGIVNAASTLTATAANGTCFQAITRANGTYTFSIDVRRKAGSGTIEITDDGGSTFTDITASINAVSYTRLQITTTQTNPSIGVRIVTLGDEIEVDYEGLEKLPFASSRIETTTTPVTRGDDDLSIPPTGNFNEVTGTVSMIIDILGYQGSQGIISVNDGTSANRHELLFSGTDLRTLVEANSVRIILLSCWWRLR